MLSSLLMAAFVAQASEEGFSKLQIFMQQLIDWGVGAGGRIIHRRSWGIRMSLYWMSPRWDWTRSRSSKCVN